MTRNFPSRSVAEALATFATKRLRVHPRRHFLRRGEALVWLRRSSAPAMVVFVKGIAAKPNNTLVVDIGRILFIGHVDEVPEHKAMVPVVGAGLDSEFTLTFAHGKVTQRTAIVRANTVRAVHAAGRLAVMPMDAMDAPAAVADEPRTLSALGVLADGFDAAAWDELSHGIGLPQRLSHDVPATVVRARELIAASADENVPVERIAGEIGLSVSRLQHLFVQHVGTSMSSYRIWHRFLAVARAIVEGRTLTDAAAGAGFFDSAHFGRAFRRAFGVPPTFAFGPGTNIYVVGS